MPPGKGWCLYARLTVNAHISIFAIGLIPLTGIPASRAKAGAIVTSLVQLPQALACGSSKRHRGALAQINRAVLHPIPVLHRLRPQAIAFTSHFQFPQALACGIKAITAGRLSLKLDRLYCILNKTQSNDSICQAGGF